MRLVSASNLRISASGDADLSAAGPQWRMMMHESSGSQIGPRCHVHVCTSCREKGAPREPQENRLGFRLYHALKSAVEQSSLGGQVEVRPTLCLSICPRPCGIALSLDGSWTYLFGDQSPDSTTGDILRCVSLYLQSPDGFMPRDQRPPFLRRSILGRVPPRLGDNACI